MQGSHTHIPETNHVPRGYIFLIIIIIIIIVVVVVVVVVVAVDVVVVVWRYSPMRTFVSLMEFSQ